jgi:hypothetical protein
MDELYLDYLNLDKQIKELSFEKKHLQLELFKKNICAECQKKYDKKDIRIKPMGTNRKTYRCPKGHLAMVVV